MVGRHSGWFRRCTLIVCWSHRSDQEWDRNPAELHSDSFTPDAAAPTPEINQPVCLCKAADISDVLYYKSSCRRSLYFWIFIVSALLNTLFLLDRMSVIFNVKFV